MYQPDLFTMEKAAGKSKIAAPEKDERAEMDLPAVLDLLASASSRPRYTFMVLELIARAAGNRDCLGPYVAQDGQSIPVRDWLSDALMPMAQRDGRRRAVIADVRADLEKRGALPSDEEAAQGIMAEEVRERLRRSGRTNVSRAVSDLVRVGLLRRHYRGYRVDHHNRGAGREAVYTLTTAAKQALGKGR
jgi:hypothetical protein